jgi:hypothetical protein
MAKNRGGTGTIYWRVLAHGPKKQKVRSASQSIRIVFAER